MRKWREKFISMAMAVAYAEQGEWGTAASLLDEYEQKNVSATLSKANRVKQRQRKREYLA